MITTSLRRPCGGAWRRRAALVVAIVALASACSTASAHHAATGGDAEAISVPLTTSIYTPEGPWATAPMGILTQPLNTFWQLFHQPAGGGAWADDVEVTATATNGGIALASYGDEVLLGVLPSQQLAYSPVVFSGDGGKSWPVNGPLPLGLTASPDALALGPTGQVLALVSSPSGPEVLQGSTALTNWPLLISEAALRSTPGGVRCGVTSLDVVGFSGSDPLVGVGCDKPGVVGLFSELAGRWQLVGPTLTGSLSSDSVKVLAARETDRGPAILLGVSGSTGSALVAAWESSSAGAGSPSGWTVSNATALATPASIDSVGPVGPTGFFALLSDSDGTTAAWQVGPSSPTWQRLTTPPATTDTLAYSASDASGQALTGNQMVLGVWQLANTGWNKTQTLPVAISIGSSG